ncbi:MAG: polysaccharide biosynthesis tyrosine autokinase [Thermodesulfobacteriota bacterium]|nr:polysaccharide biosynthesis tyrosine autokinase [Thermodesulfobacteriota bacterium]
MGKIFDALEKSKKRHKTSVAKQETHWPVENAKSENEAYVNTPILLNKDMNATDISYKRPENAEKIKKQKQVTPFMKNKVLYDVNNIDKNLVALLKPQSFETQQFKMLRTNLLFPPSGKSPRTIMVTSSTPDEGKSFVAANLAISIAQSIQEHVLLIDCDIRRPCVHTQFGFGDVPGLSEHLASGTPLSSLILKTEVNKLNVLPAGRPPHNPSELLSSQHMSKLLAEVTERYRDRYIVIDSPPPKLTAETSAISRQVDGILLVVEYGSTPRQMVSDLIDLMGKEKILGIILNKLDMRFSGYYGMGKYSKYGKYYQKY